MCYRFPDGLYPSISRDVEKALFGKIKDLRAVLNREVGRLSIGYVKINNLQVTISCNREVIYVT